MIIEIKRAYLEETLSAVVNHSLNNVSFLIAINFVYNKCEND